MSIHFSMNNKARRNLVAGERLKLFTNGSPHIGRQTDIIITNLMYILIHPRIRDLILISSDNKKTGRETWLQRIVSLFADFINTES